METTIDKILSNSISFIEQNNFESYDLFDALTCNWLDKITHNSDLARRVVIQINAKSPVSLNGLGIKKMVHTKLISDLLWTFSLRQSIDKALPIYKKLINLKCKGTDSVYGLNFPYTSRFINADANTPNIYNTTTTGLAICEFYMIYQMAEKRNDDDIGYQIANIIKSMFHVFSFKDESSKGWFSYYPGQESPTYNVNALSAYFLCKAYYAHIKDCVFIEVIQKLINLLIIEQNHDGSWYYSRSEKGKWIDGFHTGFIIESLAYIYSHGFESQELKNTIIKAWDYYIHNLFTHDGFPKYFNISTKYPIEAQNCAQSIQTLSLVGLWLNWHQKDLLKKVISNTIDNLYNPKGYFYYKRNKYYLFKQSYLRWSTAPMLVALSYADKYLQTINKKNQ